MDRRVDLAVAFCVVLLGIFVLIAAQGVKPASVPDPIGTKGTPLFVGFAFVIGGVVLIVRRLLLWRVETTMVTPDGMEDDLGVAPGSATRAMSIWACAVAYVLLLPFVGYVVATPLFVAAVLALFEVRGWRMLVIIPMAFTVLVFIVFVELLNVRLPTGITDGALRTLGLI